MMSRLMLAFYALMFVSFSACVSSPIESRPPGLPIAQVSDNNNDASNAGRVQSITVNPTDRNHAIIAMKFGGLWRTYGGGSAWFHVDTLPAVFVTDVEFGSEGKTVVATVFRDNQSINGGGIYVSHTSGDFWTRPTTGMVPISSQTPSRTSAYSVSHAPDERGLWYVGTDYGVAVSCDDGDTWAHVGLAASGPTALTINPCQLVIGNSASGSTLSKQVSIDGTTVNDRPQGPTQSVLAMPGGIVLAMVNNGVYRSDNRGMTWGKVIDANFSQEAGDGGNKMDRSPYAPWAFIFKSYDKIGGILWFYELDKGTANALPTGHGTSRGPFVRVSKDQPENGGKRITIWVGTGQDGFFVTREDAASIRALKAGDWTSFIAPAGIHSDMGDMGVDGNLQPAYMGSDGGIFKPHPTTFGRWISAAVPGSGMNSLEITDLAGTNYPGANGRFTTQLYFSTQDNKIWASPDEGHTWPNSDSQEGYSLEVRSEASSAEKVMVAYRAIGAHAHEARFSDDLLASSRDVPDVDQNGQALTNMGLPYFLSQQAALSTKPSFWVRLRGLNGPAQEVFVSGNSGSNWTKTGDLNFMPAGEIKRSVDGVIGWLPVWVGGNPNIIGLVPLAPTAGFFDHTIQTYDDSDVVRLPGNGSLGRRATEWDTHAVFGVHPLDWKFLIAPDIVSNDVKVSRDGGNSWTIDVGLTKEVLRDGELKLWDDSAYRMEVTEIAFDPYFQSRFGNRIFVGTRDAGVICSADGGQSWRTIKDSDQVKYITGFHFLPNSGFFFSSYGQGLWYAKPAEGCPESYQLPWDLPPPLRTTGNAGNTTTIARATDMPPRPRGVANPNTAKLFLNASVPASGVTILGPDNVLVVAGRGFPADKEATLTMGGSNLMQSVRIDGKGQFSTIVRVPPELPFGRYTIEVMLKSQCETAPLGIAEFIKAFSDSK
jgi:hypothetical protein